MSILKYCKELSDDEDEHHGPDTDDNANQRKDHRLVPKPETELEHV